MSGTRIRWTSAGKVAGGLAAGGLLFLVLPGLVEPPEPQPLPADVGLATGATGAYGYASEVDPVRDAAKPERVVNPRRTGTRRSSDERSRPAEGERASIGHRDRPAAAPEDRGGASEGAPSSLPVPVLPATSAPAPPAPAPAPAQSEPAEAGPDRHPMAPSPAPPREPAQFGFER